MKFYLYNLSKFLFAILFVTSCNPTISDETSSMLSQLDKLIAQSGQIHICHEAHIDSLKMQLEISAKRTPPSILRNITN